MVAPVVIAVLAFAFGPVVILATIVVMWPYQRLWNSLMVEKAYYGKQISC